jgi:hypothetical protein
LYVWKYRCLGASTIWTRKSIHFLGWFIATGGVFRMEYVGI